MITKNKLGNVVQYQFSGFLRTVLFCCMPAHSLIVIFVYVSLFSSCNLMIISILQTIWLYRFKSCPFFGFISVYNHLCSCFKYYTPQCGVCVSSLSSTSPCLSKLFYVQLVHLFWVKWGGLVSLKGNNMWHLQLKHKVTKALLEYIHLHFTGLCMNFKLILLLIRISLSWYIY